MNSSTASATSVNVAVATASGNGSGGTGNTAPYWLRIVRSADTFSASRSPGGATWTTIGSQTITMGSRVLIGLPDCSGLSSILSLTGSDNVTVVP